MSTPSMFDRTETPPDPPEVPPEVCPPPPEKCRETRIGLVMYGGVSLAVYINGVSQEFYHAVQGNGVYRLIKELTDSEIALDIVSGSSAGGINGILLGYALANGKDFTRCADLWRNSADIRRLLRSTASTEEPVRSVLDSEGYYQTELENAFRMLEGTTAYAEAPSPIKELDLFVTGTDMDGRTYQRVDDAGHIIEVKDHRAVFQLKYREGRKSNFDSKKNPAVIMALSKLARITSCFPGAFAPVFVSNSPIEGKNPDRMSANELLQYWGALPRAAYLIDGGVIDNKPFSHTIHEIFFRTTDRKVERKLYYVEPDPERFPDPGSDFIPEMPTFLKPIVSSLVAIPGYESITDDLKHLAERNENVREYRRVLQDVARLYEREATKEYGPGIPDVDEPQKSIYTRARYASISDRVLEGVFKNSTFENSPRLSEQRAALIREFDARTTGTTDTLRDFDLLFRLRRVFHLIYHLYELLYEHAPGQALPKERSARYLLLLKRLNRHMELLNVLNSATEQLVDEVNYGWDDKKENNASEIWNKVAFSLHQLLQGEGLKAHLNDLKELNSSLHRRIAQIKQNIFDIPGFRSVLLDVDDLEVAFLREVLEPGDPVLRRFLHFNEIDAHLFPIEWVSGLREKDVVQVCRISPLDAQTGFSRRDAREKTSGDSLAHFSAFFKRTWRSNDIMWGRLDGVCELIETLMTKNSLLEGMKNDASRMRARQTLLPSNGTSPIDQWFKDSSEAATQRLKAWVLKMTDDNPDVRQAAVNDLVPADPSQPGSVRELLIEMSQFRILNESLPQIFEDSIKEQVEWKRVRRRSKTNLERLEWLDTDVAVDATALDALAILGGRKILGDLAGERPTEESPQNSQLGQAFNKFRIGTEEVLNGGLPPLVLADIAARALLVLRNCALGSFSRGTAGKVRASTLYRWGVDLPLRAFYGFVIFLKTVPGFRSAVVVGLSVLSLFALFVGLNWKETIIQAHGEFNMLWFTVFIALPAIWLCVGLYQLTSSNLRRANVSDSLRHALIAICAASPVISVTLVYFGLTDLIQDWWNGTAEPAGTRDIQLIMVLLYGVVPFLLSFLGGYLAVRQSQRALEVEDFTAALEQITDSELQDISDRMGEKHRVMQENRSDIIKALTVSAEMNRTFGALERAIRATSPGVLG